MKTQERRDQMHIMELEGFAAIEQLLLIQDEHEQSQQITELQTIEQEEQQLIRRIQNWDQLILLDYETAPNLPTNEENEDSLEQLHQID